MTFPSVYEMMNPLTTVRKQHFWEYFTGKGLDAKIWQTLGSGSAGMDDQSTNGGYSLTASASGYNKRSIYFGNVSPFSPTASVFIANAKFSQTSGLSIGYVGLSADGTDGSTSRFYIGKMDSAQSSNFGASTANSTGATTHTDGSVSQDRSYHSFKGVLGSSSCQSYIDGVLDITASGSDKLPNTGLQPTALSMANTANPSIKLNIRYFEAYNT